MTNLKDKIQDLLKNTKNAEVKALCEAYLKSEGDGALTESLFAGLRGLVSKDSDVSKLVSETESFNKTKMELEQQISKNAAQRLIENWGLRKGQKTSNVGTDTTRQTENINKAKQEELLLEGLKAINTDEVKSIVDKKSRDSYKIAEAIEKIRESQIASHPNVKYVLARYEKALSEGVKEYAIVRDFTASLNPFIWDKAVKEAYNMVNNLVQERAAEIEVQNAIEQIRATDSKRFYAELTTRMNEWVYSDNKNIHDLARDMKGYMFNPLVKSLANKLMLMENSKGTTFNIPVKGSNCTINKIYSPVLETTNGRVFKAASNFYHSTKTSLTRLSEKQVNALPAKFLELCEAFSTASVVDDKVTLYLGKNKIQMFEDKRIFINERQIDPSTLGSQLLYFTQINVFDKTSTVINKIMNVYENLDTICEIDYGKAITSNVFEGVGALVFKKEKDIYVNKINPTMNENSFYKANSIQAVNMIKEFLSFNMSESLGSFLEGDYKKKEEMQKSAQVVLSNIALVESDIEKLDKATLIDPTLNDVEEIKEAKSLLENELNNLKAEFQTINDRIQKFETIVKEEEEEEEGEPEEIVIDEPAEEPAAEPVAEEPVAAEVPATEEPAAEPVALPANDLVSQGIAGAQGAQSQEIKGNDNIDLMNNNGVPGDVVQTGFNGAEGSQNAAAPAADAIKQPFEPAPVITQGNVGGEVAVNNNTGEIQVAKGNEEPIAEPAQVQASVEIPAAPSDETPAEPVEEPVAEPAEEPAAEPVAEPAEEPAAEPTDDVDGEKKNDEPVEENENEPGLGIDSKVKVISRNETGTITAINDGEYSVLLDSGETIPVKQSDIQNLEGDIEDNIKKNEAPVVTENEEGIETEGDDNENPDVLFVKATLEIDLGPFKAGEVVEIDASAYTAGGEDDPVKIKDAKEGVSEIPKKYLKLADEAGSPVKEMGDIQSKTENLIRGLEELETFLKAEDKIGGKAIEDAKAKLKSFADSLSKEKGDIPAEE